MMKMVSFLTPFVLLIFVTVNVFVGALNEYKVGDDVGWREPEVNSSNIYNQWAAKKRFQVGDSIYFDYKNDSVLVVEKGGYYHCNTTKPISSFTDGKTVIKINRPGPFYFISGAPNHCKNGQRLIIDVLTQHPSQQPSSSTAQPYSTDSPSPSPSPSPNSATTDTIFSLVHVFMAIYSLFILV